MRDKVAHVPELTLSATVDHINNAVRKLSQLRIASLFGKDASTVRLYRGIRGELPPTIAPDDHGLLCFTDYGFMSTSCDIATPLQYMGAGESNLLWEIQVREQDVAHHMGADVSQISQYPAEREILFPPMTMLNVRMRDGNADDGEAAARRTGDWRSRFHLHLGEPGHNADGDEVRYDRFEVLPFFV